MQGIRIRCITDLSPEERIKMKNRKAQVAIGLVCIILSFFIVVQFKSVKKNSVSTYPSQVRLEQAQELLRLEKEKNEALYKQVMEYKDQIAEYQTHIQTEDGQVDMLKTALNNAEIQAGTVSVEGSGLEIKMADGDTAGHGASDDNLYIVHQDDVLKVLNELRAAGAEAISVNDQRVIATSEIRCAGNTISINNTRTAAPFVIKAIGDPKQLESGLMMRGGIMDELSSWIKIEIKKVDKGLVIPAYMGKFEFKYAKVITNAEAVQKK